eukprot:218716-Pyramimonas_sp.AAC.1
MHRLHIPGTAVNDIYGGECNVTRLAGELGKATGKCRDLCVTGDELLLPSAQAETMRELEAEDPCLTIAPFPCDA